MNNPKWKFFHDVYFYFKKKINLQNENTVPQCQGKWTMNNYDGNSIDKKQHKKWIQECMQYIKYNFSIKTNVSHYLGAIEICQVAFIHSRCFPHDTTHKICIIINLYLNKHTVCKQNAMISLKNLLYR